MIKNYKTKPRIIVGIIILVLCAGLLVSFLIANLDSTNRFALNIFSETNARGAIVLINGVEKGKMKKFGERRTRFAISLTKDKYDISVMLGENILCQKSIDISSKESEIFWNDRFWPVSDIQNHLKH